VQGDHRPTAQEFLGHPPLRGRRCGYCCVKKWRELGSTGLVCFFMGIGLFLLLAYLEEWNFWVFDFGKHHDASPIDLNEYPEYFNERGVPQIFKDYVRRHNEMISSPLLPSSKFVYYEIPGECTSLAEALLGLTSAFLYGILSGRGLLVGWTESWLTKVDAGTNVSQAERRSSLDDLLVNPSFSWGWKDFELHYMKHGGQLSEISPHTLSVLEHSDAAVCEDLRTWLSDHKVVQLSSWEYFVPLLLANEHFYDLLNDELLNRPGEELFALLANFVVRPVPRVIFAIDRFKERYFENNYVVSVEITTQTETWEPMSAEHQRNFFTVAATTSSEALETMQAKGDSRGIVLFIVTDDEESISNQMQQLGENGVGVGPAGVVAITSAQGHGTLRLLNQLQNMWLLGYSNQVITTPGSKFGIFGHARTSLTPIIVLDEGKGHESESSQPCLADIGLVQHASCFQPSMLTKISYDPSVPC